MKTENERILKVTREMLSAERIAVQNAEFGNEAAVNKYQLIANQKMQELELLLEDPMRMRMINGHPNGDPNNDPPSLR